MKKTKSVTHESEMRGSQKPRYSLPPFGPIALVPSENLQSSLLHRHLAPIGSQKGVEQSEGIRVRSVPSLFF